MNGKTLNLLYTSWAYPCVASVPPPDLYFQLSFSLSLFLSLFQSLFLSLSCPHVFGNPVILLIWQRCLRRRKILNIVWGQALLLNRQVGATHALHVSNPFFLFSSLSLPLPRLLLSALIFLFFFLSFFLSFCRSAPPPPAPQLYACQVFLSLFSCDLKSVLFWTFI